MTDTPEKPVFGNPPSRRTSKPVTRAIGQRALRIEVPVVNLDNPEPVLGRRRALVKARELAKEPWETLLLERTTGDIPIQGRHHEISADATPLRLWNYPPRMGGAKKVGLLRPGNSIFVIKDSEKADDRLRRGWAELVVLEQTAPGEKPRAKTFNDGFKDVVVCRASYQGILSRIK
jgi:hypothetical protein